MTDSNTHRMASATATHHSRSVSGSSPERRENAYAAAQTHANTTARILPGPAATPPSLRRGASDVHGVGWSMAGKFGWLVTAVITACQLAAAAAPSVTAAGSAVRITNPGRR